MTPVSEYQPTLDAIRVPDAPRVDVRTFERAILALIEIRGEANHGWTDPAPRDDAYLIQLRMRDCMQSDYFVDQKHVEPNDRKVGAVQFHDLRNDIRVHARDPFHVLDLYLPCHVLAAIGDEAGVPAMRELEVVPGGCFRDQVIRSLMCAMAQMMARPDEASQLLVDHVAHALAWHVGHAYGGLQRRRAQPPRGGLAPWQAKRAREMLSAELERDLPLALLAQSCGLSLRHFSRAFRQSVGMPPHAYRMQRRLSQARQMLKGYEYSLAEIALLCGFASQSHLTRVFQSAVGESPGRWRRSHRSAPRTFIAGADAVAAPRIWVPEGSMSLLLQPPLPDSGTG